MHVALLLGHNAVACIVETAQTVCCEIWLGEWCLFDRIEDVRLRCVVVLISCVLVHAFFCKLGAQNRFHPCKEKPSAGGVTDTLVNW